MTSLSSGIAAWLRAPMVRWQVRYERTTADVLMAVSDQAARQAVYLARLSAYISRRMSGGKHDDAVKAQNRAARQVRQALGYTYKDDKITF